ncbi:neutral/alkaline non-lysosomal ceramidase N-terminal domain-containing protein [Schlesneria sp. T3-172]|uniref:neutral/alkaline non-lysosomal ceramidase N-terminal domain-containing protein n=1 Tax=Schlesneria sphaerica TaxID=3373610 RepID=UPI0037C76BE2
MKKRSCPTPEARVRFGLGVVDITPPIGIYHRMFGAAAHDRATGIHRPLQADVIAIGGVDQGRPDFIRVVLDHCGFVGRQHREFIRRVSEAANLPAEQVVVGYSHTHSGGWYMPDRFGLEGGELIPAYLSNIGDQLAAATRSAIADMKVSHLSYATSRCTLAANRDYWDEDFGRFVCGYNPEGVADDTVTVARISTDEGSLRAVLVHYACHPTTLGWENSLISPDYVGALRETVSQATGVPCVYWQGALGDLGPRVGFVGDVSVADRNGRLLGFAALSALESLGPCETEFQYAGPVISGATLGTWKYAPTDPSRRERQARVSGTRLAIPFPLKPHDDPETLERERVKMEDLAAQAHQRGDVVAARDCRAKAERAKRALGRLANLPPGDTYPLSVSVHVVGESVWITSGGEPYQVLAKELRTRFPHLTVLYSPLADGVEVGYLLPEGEYGKGLYQEEPTILPRGSLEVLRDTLIQKVEKLLEESSPQTSCAKP